MEQSPELIEFVNALQILHDPKSNQNDRQFAHNICESAKSDDLRAYSLASQLVSASLPHHLYEHLITKRWNTLDPSSRAQLKIVSLEIISKWNTDLLVEPRFLKEKAVQIVALIAKREWPHQWPSLFAELTSLSRTGDSHCELVLHVLRGIAEGMFDEDQLSDARRNELLVALNNEFASLFAFCFQVLEEKFLLFQSSVDLEKQKAKCLVSAALKMFEAYAPLSSFQVLAQCGLLQAICALLANPDLRGEALGVLQAICAKKCKDVPHEAVTNLVGSLLELCKGGLLQQTEFDFHKGLCVALTELGLNFWTSFSSQQTIVEGYLSLMASFTNYHALAITAITTPFWRNYLDGQNAVTGVNLPPQIHEALMATILDKVSCKPGSDWEDLCGVEEFSDFDEYFKFWGQVKAKVLEIVRKLANLMPLNSIMFIGAQWQNALQQTQELLLNGVQSLDEKVDSRIEALQSVLENIILGVPLANFQNENDDVNGACRMLVGILVSRDVNGQIVMASIVRMGLVVLIPFLRMRGGDSGLGAEIISKMLNFYDLFPISSESSFVSNTLRTSLNLSDTVTMRRRLSAAIVKLAHAMSAHLLPYRDQINNKVQSLFSSGQVTGEETSHLYELLFVLSNPLPSDAERAAFLDSIMMQPLAEWNDPVLTQAMSDPHAWVQGGIAGEIIPSEETYYNLRQVRHRIHQVLITLLCICRRVQAGGGGMGTGVHSSNTKNGSLYSISNHISSILPNLSLLIKSIHTLWTPDVRTRLSQEWQVLYKPVEFEAAVDPSFAKAGNAALETQKGPSSLESRVTDVYTWIRHVRDGSYQLAGIISGFCDGFYVVINSNPSYLENILGLAPAMEHRHLRSILRLFVGPLIRNCPSALYMRILRPFLPSFLSLLLNRLDGGYKTMKDRDSGVSSAGASQGTEKDDIIFDQILRLLHREVGELVLSLVDEGQGQAAIAAAAALMEVKNGTAQAEGDNPNKGGVTGTQQGKELTEFVLACPDIGPVLVQLMCNAFIWPDSTASSRAMLSLQKMLAGDLLGIVLLALTSKSNPLESIASEAALLHLLRDIYMNLVTITPLVRQQLLRLPGINPADLDYVQETLLGKMMAEKKQRAMLKDLIKPCTGEEGADSIRALGGVVPSISRSAKSTWSEEQRQLCFEWLETTEFS
ncbi:hypothetical protein GUITHDRAFT_163474 [Guillardia theta CCMP2712]|uniref:Uncharacterized protein n=1 Tax=Guillardia theta (strain CCMP2712) TaxID=905079 RepID=L1J9V8_GUITC|nr:hypothetical protein GUITHDRAFT_163474 [Guillardia theta CCMP2712]EKX44889.1 hypothetical protein GUITHDRAFT_163474 [Guillardia theta CCMP2712]|eukprot:XP_005831869.1 hypothetical protein GUITHDRAFT_163474 [Guillardia theta CCMP2712]